MRDLKTLTVGQAKELVLHNDGYLSLDALTDLSDDVANALAEHKGGNLNIHALTKLTDAAAKALERYSGVLCLNGVTSLSDEAIEALGRRAGDLYLNGLTTLSDVAAHALAQHTYELVLGGLITLSHSAMYKLAQHKGPLTLGVVSLSPKAAEALAQHKGPLALSRLTELSGDAAKALSKHEGSLELSRLMKLAPDAAIALAEHVGRLSLNSLSTLSLAAAQALAYHEGHLALNGLTRLSPAVATALSHCSGDLSLMGLHELTDKVAIALAKHRGNLYLNGVTNLSDEAAINLANHRGGLVLNGLATLSDKAAKALAQHKDYLYLRGLTTVSGNAAEALRGNPAISLSAELKSFGDSARRITRGLAETRGRVSITDGRVLQLVGIAAGSFMMGSPEAEAGRRSDERQVFVEITRPFQISEVAVTEEQWARVMGLSSGHGDGRPAVKVNWQQACLFCELLTAMEREAGLIDAGQAYRLPTEAEWEYCCRAGSSIAYSFGEDACELSDYALYYGVTYERLGEHPEEHVFNCTADDQGYIRDYAGEKTPNAWGLHDMHGNVLEWCADWYAEQLGGGENPRGPFTGTERVCRGGYCWSSEADCRSAARSHELPIRSCCYIGFRVVLGAAT